MMRPFDYLIVGSGLSGAVFAREAMNCGKRVMIVEKRNHIGGNCYTFEHPEAPGINVHKYGPHIFHTANKPIWDYVRQFADFNNFTYRCKVNFNSRMFSFPINLMTLHQLWGVNTPQQAKDALVKARLPIENPVNLEEWALSQVGEEIYYTFLHGYTSKQWARDPKELPKSIITRLPIRLTYNDRYYPDKDRYEGIPIGGYTQIFNRLLEKAQIELDTDFFEHRTYLESLAEKVIYTGPIDAYFDYRHGRLEYRSLRFEHEVLDGDFQGNAGVNYTALDVPFTRIIEHKHFEFLEHPKTVITREYPQEFTESNEPFYPVTDETNRMILARYMEESKSVSTLFLGRLAQYIYMDMHVAIAAALKAARDEFERN